MPAVQGVPRPPTRAIFRAPGRIFARSTAWQVTTRSGRPRAGGVNLPSLYAGHGEDRLSGGNAAEILQGDDDKDQIEAGAGTDVLMGARHGCARVRAGPRSAGRWPRQRSARTAPPLRIPHPGPLIRSLCLPIGRRFAHDRAGSHHGRGNESCAGASVGLENPGAALGDMSDLRSVDANFFEVGNRVTVFGSTEPGGPMLVDVCAWIDDSTFAAHVNLNIDGDDAPEMMIVIEDGDRASAGNYAAEDFVLWGASRRRWCRSHPTHQVSGRVECDRRVRERSGLSDGSF